MAAGDFTVFENSLMGFPEAAVMRFMELRLRMRALFPEANELVYDNYNALVSGFSVSLRMGDVFGTVGLMRPGRNLHVGFIFGSRLPDPERKLLGNGAQYRYFQAMDPALYPADYAENLLKTAFMDALARRKPDTEPVSGLTVLKSVSAKKRT